MLPFDLACSDESRGQRDGEAASVKDIGVLGTGWHICNGWRSCIQHLFIMEGAMLDQYLLCLEASGRLLYRGTEGTEALILVTNRESTGVWLVLVRVRF